MTFPAGGFMPQGGQQQGAPSQGGWQQMPIPDGSAQVQQPNFQNPAFQQGAQQGQQRQHQPIPAMQQQYDGGSIQMPMPNIPQQQQPQQGQFQQQGQPSQQVPNQGWQGQQPQQQVQQPQRQQNPMLSQQQGAQVQIDAQGRLSGPGVPAELQGRTLAEGLQSYGMMRQMALGLAQPQRGVPQQGQQVQQGQPQLQQQQATPAQQVGAQGQARSFWADPEGAIQRIVEERLAPVTQMTQLQQVQSARDAVAAQYPQFAQYEAAVIQRLQGMRPEVLANPQAWQLAFQQVVGEAALQGGRFPAGQQPAQQQVGNQGWQPYQNQGNQGGPRLGDFFTESPAAGFSGNGAQGDISYGLTPAQQEAARRFGMSNEQYARGAGMIP